MLVFDFVRCFCVLRGSRLISCAMKHISRLTGQRLTHFHRWLSYLRETRVSREKTLQWHLPSLSVYFFMVCLAVAGLFSSADPWPSDRQPHNCMMSECNPKERGRTRYSFIHTYKYEDRPGHTVPVKVSVELCESFVRGKEVNLG